MEGETALGVRERGIEWGGGHREDWEIGSAEWDQCWDGVKEKQNDEMEERTINEFNYVFINLSYCFFPSFPIFCSISEDKTIRK